VADKVTSHVGWEPTPTRRECEQQAISPRVRRVSVRAVQQPVVHDHGIASLKTERNLIRVVAHGGMRQREVSGGVGVRLGEQRVQGRASVM
jgi:hypothetical protein